MKSWGRGVLLLGVLTGCQDSLLPPRPPSYDKACVPSHDYYVRMAHDTQDMGTDPIPADPREAIAKALLDLEDRGVVVSEKSKSDPTAEFSMALPGRVLLSHGFYMMDDRMQAATLWHELVHVRQWERLGERNFLRHYVMAEGRWALEVPAYRESLRVMRHFEMSEDGLKKAAKGQFDSLYEKYGIGTMPRECTEQMTFTIWDLDR